MDVRQDDVVEQRNLQHLEPDNLGQIPAPTLISCDTLV